MNPPDVIPDPNDAEFEYVKDGPERIPKPYEPWWNSATNAIMVVDLLCKAPHPCYTRRRKVQEEWRTLTLADRPRMIPGKTKVRNARIGDPGEYTVKNFSGNGFSVIELGAGFFPGWWVEDGCVLVLPSTLTTEQQAVGHTETPKKIPQDNVTPEGFTWHGSPVNGEIVKGQTIGKRVERDGTIPGLGPTHGAMDLTRFETLPDDIEKLSQKQIKSGASLNDYLTGRME